MKISELKDMIKKAVKETSSTGGTATATAGIGEQYFAQVRTKKNSKKDPSGFTPAPSIPNRKSKAMDYKKIFEDEEERILTGGIPFKKETGEDYHKITITEPLPDDVKDRMIRKFLNAEWDAKPNNAGGITAVKKIFENSNTVPIQRAELITKLQPLKDLPLKYKVSDDDIRSLAFVATKAEIMKIWKNLGTLGVQDYFDPPLDDSEFSGKGTWVINAQEALDNGLILSSIKEDENLEEAYVPDNVKAFAKRKGVTSLVNKVAGWAEKAGKRVVGGTAIGKNYGTLILDLTHHGSEVYIDIDEETIEVKGQEVYDYKSFVNALGSQDKTINENYAQFRNQTSQRNGPEQLHKAVQEIKRKLHEVNRLLEYTEKLKSEISETSGEVKYKVHTERALEQITEMIKQTYIKSKKLK